MNPIDDQEYAYGYPINLAIDKYNRRHPRPLIGEILCLEGFD